MGGGEKKNNNEIIFNNFQHNQWVFFKKIKDIQKYFNEC
jgi:hypothetical protein